MAGYIRELVSKGKRRYHDEKYNLDLTYITPKLIAMSFPGSGIRKLFRNSIDTVAKFLEEHHRNTYKLFNLSQNTFDKSKFNY
jgi:phosphatidylinositol-3,4,5-trisphosphate 3-phosphatase/dual-specificity protein phosphatase PTEN